MKTKLLYNSPVLSKSMGVVLNHSNFPDPLGVRFMNEKIVSLIQKARGKGYETPEEIAGFINNNTAYKITILKDFERAYL